ncbi:MAG: hypothetical protein OXN89_00100 [Bryobacterales bacterium]|nr:hypothetical protein [Bryobacterales bacterium]
MKEAGLPLTHFEDTSGESGAPDVTASGAAPVTHDVGDNLL